MPKTIMPKKLCHIIEHEYEMAEASGHHEKMEDFMRTKIFVPCIKDRQLQRIDNAADRIKDPACQKPEEGSMGKQMPEPPDDG